MFFNLSEIRPGLEEPAVHHSFALCVEPLQEHPHDIRDLPHDEHHH